DCGVHQSCGKQELGCCFEFVVVVKSDLKNDQRHWQKRMLYLSEPIVVPSDSQMQANEIESPS
ncbi:unnamed protein product, partial [Ilex paraguariensis]